MDPWQKETLGLQVGDFGRMKRLRLKASPLW
jgi:hypothetical protein